MSEDKEPQRPIDFYDLDYMTREAIIELIVSVVRNTYNEEED